MPLKNACFISYRHRDSSSYQDLIDELHKLLSDEISYYSSSPVYLDKTRLQGGTFFNNALARNLCESICMVSVYIPPYFDTQETYCAREYKAMEMIEAQRLKLLSPEAPSQHGLIIPIVCRDWERFPQVIRKQRHAYNFEPYLTRSKRLTRSTEATKAIKEIAKYIYERSLDLKRLKVDPCKVCTKFSFPSEAAVLPWLRKVEGSKPIFPR